MDFDKCKRCGGFHISGGEVCPKCAPKDNLEYANFKKFISQNSEMESKIEISCQTGISLKNVNRFINQDPNNSQGIIDI